MINQHVPQRAPQNQTGGPSIAPQGPRWAPSMYPGDRVPGWKVTKVRQNGRVIHWVAPDGRTAITTATAAHPQCPPEPTPKQLKADKDADEYEASRRDAWDYD